MNEQDLRDRWQSALTASEPYRAAQLEVEVDKAKRAAKYAKALKGVTSAEERAVLFQKQRDEEGTGAGEIKLAALNNAHKGEVDRYIDTATKDHAAQMAKADFTTLLKPEPDFSTHSPYIEPGYFHVGGGEPTGTHAQALKAVTKAAGGKKFEPSGDPALDHATQTMVEQQKLKATIENARKVRLQEIQNNRPRQPINVDQFKFDRGGTIEKDGRTFTVNPGFGRMPMTTPYREGDNVDDFGRMKGTGVTVTPPDVTDRTKVPSAPRPQARPLVF